LPTVSVTFTTVLVEPPLGSVSTKATVRVFVELLPLLNTMFVMSCSTTARVAAEFVKAIAKGVVPLVPPA